MVVAAIEDSGGPVGLDTETTGLNPLQDRLRLIQLATDRGVYVLDLFALTAASADLSPLIDVLGAVEVIAHNAKFDLQMMAQVGFVPGRVFCTQLASQVLHAGERAPTRARLGHKLRDVVARELGREVDKTAQKSDWSKPLTPAQLAYAAADATVLLPLAEALKEKLAAANLTETAEREMKAVPGIAWAAPLRVDVSAWEALASAAEQDVDRLTNEMNDLAPNKGALWGGWKWSSPEQAKLAFKSLGVELESTEDAVLAAVTHPLGALFRQFRSAAKKVGTYGRDWLIEYAPTGRVMASWQQLGQDDKSVDTGRMSCTAPNLQQVPRGSAYRQCFVAGPGNVLVKADYSQIELRIAARVSGDTVTRASSSATRWRSSRQPGHAGSSMPPSYGWGPRSRVG
ncbi:MAG: hypothetical protein JWO38_3012 [Gemmataceae bacterium]|nr:hypothetical protein [Gemmataceae bacterium]